MIQNYLETLLTEKGINLNHTIEVKSNNIFGSHYIPMKVVIEFIETLSTPVQDQIRKTLVRIDFMNGDVLHYFQFISEGMVQLQFSEN